MSETEAMDQFDRLLAAGYLPPGDPEDKPGAVFREWFAAFRTYDAADVSEAITRLKTTKTDRFWPMPAELRAFLPRASSPSAARCATCGDNRWVEGGPYKANGGHVYEGVRRCPDCGIPAPRVEGRGRQTPLSGVEFQAWQAARRHPHEIRTHEEFVARVEVLFARMSARSRAIPSGRVGGVR